MNLLWNGIGERSLVEIPINGVQGVVVDLKRDGINIFQNYQGVRERYLDLDGDVFFESGSAKLADDVDSDDLQDITAVINSHKSEIEKIYVVGHADATSFMHSDKKNNDLAVERAKSISSYIQKKTNIDGEKIKPDGHGAREPKTLCKDWPVKATLSQCLATNRRVEIRIKFTPSATAPKGVAR